jgi:hypothetical protein
VTNAMVLTLTRPLAAAVMHRAAAVELSGRSTVT